MNYEDRFIPSENGNNIDDNFIDIQDKQKKSFDQFKFVNKRFHKANRRLENRKQSMIEYYSSGDIGSCITSATSGIKYKEYIVGSKHEDLFFKVSISNGEFVGKGSLTLFYDSPEQFEKHQYIELSLDVKQKWYEKYMKYKLKMIK